MINKLLLALTVYFYYLSLLSTCAFTSALHFENEKVRRVEFTVDGEKILLDLTKIKKNVWSHQTPVWTVKSNSTAKFGHVFEQINKNHKMLVGEFYEDFKSKAVLYSLEANGQIYYDGVCGEDRVSKKIPHHPQKLRHSSVPKPIDNIPYVPPEYNKILENITNILKKQFFYMKRLSRSLKILYPKLLLVIEPNYLKLFNGSITETVKYLAIYWNAVNQKYQEIRLPEVNIKITGVVIAQDTNALSFINQSIIEKEKKIGFDLTQVMNLGAKYFQFPFIEEVNYKNYDHAILMTNLPSLTTNCIGAAHFTTICQRLMVYLLDDANYKVRVGAHEVGHLLGMGHDNNLFNTNKMSYTYGSIMFSAMLSVARLFWSQRSLVEIKEFAKLDAVKCLRLPYRDY